MTVPSCRKQQLRIRFPIHRKTRVDAMGMTPIPNFSATYVQERVRTSILCSKLAFKMTSPDAYEQIPQKPTYESPAEVRLPDSTGRC